MSNASQGQPPQPTRALKQFGVLLGEWAMVGVHPLLPSAVQGHSSFEWLKEDALLAWHFEWDPGREIPSAFCIIGHDDAVEPCSVLYTDVRGVARIYQMSLAGGVWKMWRDASDFSQRMRATFSDDGNSIIWHGEMSHDGSTWEPDLSVTYTRVL